MPTVTSSFLGLNLVDFIKGAVVAVLSSTIPVAITLLNEGSLSFNWEIIGVVALSSFLGYIMKNLGTAQSVQIPVDKTTAKLLKQGRLDAKVVDPKEKVV